MMINQAVGPRPTDRPPRLVCVTGATGYIGAALCRRLVQRGHQVRALSRVPPLNSGPALQHVPYNLRADLQPGALDDADAVIHLATETDRGAATDHAAELLAVHRLLAAAAGAQARFVFVSSQTARGDAPTAYGRSKWANERAVLYMTAPAGGSVVRPGMVYGGAEKGLFGGLARIIRRFRIVPVLWPAPQVQPVHVDDLADALIAVALRPSIKPELFCVAALQPVPFHSFLRAIADGRIDRRILPVPVPLPVLLPVLTAVAGLLPALDPGRLRSLADLPPMATADSLAMLGLQLRPTSAGMTRSGRSTRLQLIEARTLLHYILGTRPGSGIMRRYVRALAKFADPPVPLHVSRLLRWQPWCMAWYDQPPVRRGAAGAALFKRIDLAMAIAESSPGHGGRFIVRDDQSNRRLSGLLRLAGLGGRLCVEGAVQILSLPFRARLIRRLPSLFSWPTPS
jgi:nucleoside-diphosphate-sugar epimerase